jgi:pimeloyl-ACP methyl ester carboxylesterase
MCLLATAAAGCALPVADTWTAGGVMTGARGDEAICRKDTAAVWVTVQGQGDCIHYVLTDRAPGRSAALTPIVYLHGDVISSPSFDSPQVNVWLMSRDTVRQFVEARAVESLRPYLFVGRPGVYGSSGSHRDRRLLREAELVNAALDVIKKRQGFEMFVLSGFSGGGHLVGALLARRNDIACGVIASGVVAVQARVVARGWPRDVTGHAIVLDPITEVSRIQRGSSLRVFVIGDPEDRNVPFRTQALYHEALKQAGIDAYLVAVKGTGPENHVVSRPMYDAARWCADGMPSAQIIRWLSRQ